MLDDSTPTPIAGTEGQPFVPVFSPDGRWVAFVATAEGRYLLKKVPVEGGAAITLARAADDLHPRFTSSESDLWWSGGQLVFANRSGILAMSDDGGPPQQLVSSNPTTEVVSSPQLIRGGSHVLFTVRRLGETGIQANTLVVQAVGSESRKVVVTGGARGRLLPSGHLAYSSGTNLVGVAFDEDRLEIVGDPIVLASDVTYWSVSDTGTLVYEPIPASTGTTILWVDRDGREHPIVTPSLAQVLNLRLSPDRSRLAFRMGDDIWLWTFARNTLTPLARPTTVEADPTWMPDGRRIVFASRPETAGRQILVQSADGSGTATIVTEPPGGWPSATSPDGKFLVFESIAIAGTLMLQPIDPPVLPKPLVKGNANVAEFSPDGRWIAYQSSESGRVEVYVQPFPAVETGRWQISTGGGGQPLGSPAGRELFFVDGTGTLLAVPVDTRTGFVAGTPKTLFSVNQFGFRITGAKRNYDVSLDGRQFLFSRRSTAGASIEIVTNWFEEIAT